MEGTFGLLRLASMNSNNGWFNNEIFAEDGDGKDIYYKVVDLASEDKGIDYKELALEKDFTLTFNIQNPNIQNKVNTYTFKIAGIIIDADTSFGDNELFVNKSSYYDLINLDLNSTITIKEVGKYSYLFTKSPTNESELENILNFTLNDHNLYDDLNLSKDSDYYTYIDIIKNNSRSSGLALDNVEFNIQV